MLTSPEPGLGVQIDVLEDVVAERKYGELAQLRKDLGTTHTRVSIRNILISTCPITMSGLLVV